MSCYCCSTRRARWLGIGKFILNCQSPVECILVDFQLGLVSLRFAISVVSNSDCLLPREFRKSLTSFGIDILKEPRDDISCLLCELRSWGCNRGDWAHRKREIGQGTIWAWIRQTLANR